MARGSRSGSSIRRRRSSGNCDRCNSAAPVSDVVVSIPPTVVRNVIDLAMSCGSRTPSISWCAIAVSASSRGDAIRSAELFVDPLHHRAVRLRGLAVFGRAGRVRGDAVEGVREHLPLLARIAEPFQRDRGGDRTGEVVDELALAALDHLVEVVRGPEPRPGAQALRRLGREELRERTAVAVPAGRVALLGEHRRELAVVERDRVLLGADPLRGEPLPVAEGGGDQLVVADDPVAPVPLGPDHRAPGVEHRLQGIVGGLAGRRAEEVEVDHRARRARVCVRHRLVPPTSLRVLGTQERLKSKTVDSRLSSVV